MRKTILLFMLMALPVVAVAQDRADLNSPLWKSIANLTPRGFESAARESGWKFLIEDDTDVYWYSYWTGDNSRQTAIVLKEAKKGMGEGASAIYVASGFVDCRGAPSGHFPNFLTWLESQAFNANGIPLPGGAPLQAASLAPERNSPLAFAVKKACIDSTKKKH